MNGGGIGGRRQRQSCWKRAARRTVVPSDGLSDLNRRSVPSTEEKPAVEAELHVRGAAVTKGTRESERTGRKGEKGKGKITDEASVPAARKKTGWEERGK
jgi:hypothetical protein